LGFGEIAEVLASEFLPVVFVFALLGHWNDNEVILDKLESLARIDRV
jgi:hypothetical protein